MEIFNLSKRWALIFSLPTLIPLMFVIADFFFPKDEVRTIVIEKNGGYKSRSIRFQFQNILKGVSRSDYPKIQVGDSVVFSEGYFLREVDKIYIIDRKETIDIYESPLTIGIGFFIAGPFWVFVYGLFRKSPDEEYFEASLKALYVFCIFISYMTLLVSLCSMVSRHKNGQTWL